MSLEAKTTQELQEELDNLRETLEVKQRLANEKDKLISEKEALIEQTKDISKLVVLNDAVLETIKDNERECADLKKEKNELATLIVKIQNQYNDLKDILEKRKKEETNPVVVPNTSIDPADIERISNVIEIVKNAKLSALNLSPAYKTYLKAQKKYLDKMTDEQKENLVNDYLTISNIGDANIKTQIVENSRGNDSRYPNGIIFIYPALFLSIDELKLYSKEKGSFEEAKVYIKNIFSLLLDENVSSVHTKNSASKELGFFNDEDMDDEITTYIHRSGTAKEAEEEIFHGIVSNINDALPESIKKDYFPDDNTQDPDINIVELSAPLIKDKLQYLFSTRENKKIAEKKAKRSLEREPSMLVSKQTGGDCWNYSVCRVIVRLICNVMDIADQNILDCNTLYDALSKINMRVARVDCKASAKPNPEDSADYVKLLLYVFLVYHGYAKFAECNRFTASGKGVKEEKIKLNGKAVKPVLNFFSETILANKNLFGVFEDYLSDLWFENVPEVAVDLKFEFSAVLLPLLNEFSYRTNYSSAVKSEQMLGATQEFEKVINTINNVLDSGLYIVISVFLGPDKSLYSQKFSGYRKGVLRPYAKTITLGKTEDEEGDDANRLRIKKQNQDALGSHAMVLTKYDIEEDTGKFVYNIRNSWGSNWGDNGTIQFFLSELISLHARFNWIEPDDLKGVTKQPRIPKKIKVNPYEKIEG